MLARPFTKLVDSPFSRQFGSFHLHSRLGVQEGPSSRFYSSRESSDGMRMDNSLYDSSLDDDFLKTRGLSRVRNILTEVDIATSLPKPKPNYQWFQGAHQDLKSPVTFLFQKPMHWYISGGIKGDLAEALKPAGGSSKYFYGEECFFERPEELFKTGITVNHYHRVPIPGDQLLAMLKQMSDAGAKSEVLKPLDSTTHALQLKGQMLKVLTSTAIIPSKPQTFETPSGKFTREPGWTCCLHCVAQDSDGQTHYTAVMAEAPTVRDPKIIRPIREVLEKMYVRTSDDRLVKVMRQHFGA
eukprot:gb/GEZN01011849.1/.p1 GENE.gb/GEZN01011849.1/~~gb/GEZN01011849.1/.p1  ORF type:complete len:298 (+),score=39.99 gb/GEZN01011849.1/:141-1034(+)